MTNRRHKLETQNRFQQSWRLGTWIGIILCSNMLQCFATAWNNNFLQFLFVFFHFIFSFFMTWGHHPQCPSLETASENNNNNTLEGLVPSAVVWYQPVVNSETSAASWRWYVPCSVWFVRGTHHAAELSAPLYDLHSGLQPATSQWRWRPVEHRN